MLRTACRNRIGPIVLLGCLAALGACASPVKMGALPRYPAAIAQEETVDIQVFRDGTTLRFTNTTAERFGPCRVWVNAWYGRQIDGVDIGETIALDLYSFKDTNGVKFRAGGFFAVEQPDDVVLTQLEIDDRLIGLVTVQP